MVGGQLLQAALAGINALAEAANAALEAVGLDPALSTLDPATFRIDSVANPHAARDAERRAALAAQIRGIVSGSPLSEYFNDVRDRALQISITPDDSAEGGTGGGGGPLQTAEEVAAAADVAATGWAAVSEALSIYATEAANWGGSVGEAITSAFRAGEEANSIALGRFSSEAGARRRLEELQGKGVQARAEPVGGTPAQAWLDARLPAEVAPASLARIAPSQPLDCAQLR